MALDNGKKLINQKEAMSLLQVCVQTLYKWRQEGLTYYTLDERVILYDIEELLRFAKMRPMKKGNRQMRRRASEAYLTHLRKQAERTLEGEISPAFQRAILPSDDEEYLG